MNVFDGGTLMQTTGNEYAAPSKAAQDYIRKITIYAMARDAKSIRWFAISSMCSLAIAMATFPAGFQMASLLSFIGAGIHLFGLVLAIYLRRLKRKRAAAFGVHV